MSQSPSPATSKIDKRFDEILEGCKSSLHGSRSFNEFGDFFKEFFKKTKQVASFLTSRGMFRPPIRFEDVPPAFWSEHGNENPVAFPFLQGDLITAKHVTAPAGLGRPDVRLWQVLARDCDTYKSAWLRVAPVHEVRTEKWGGDPRDDPAGILKTALFFRTPHRFAMPPLEDDRGDIAGYFADLSIPYFLPGSHAPAATQVASLTETGWHLLSAVIVASTTRMENLDESVGLRSLDISEES